MGEQQQKQEEEEEEEVVEQQQQRVEWGPRASGGHPMGARD